MRLEYDRVLVTGGAGFIGSHTVDALLESEAKVWVLDDLSTGSVTNLRRWKKQPRLRIIQGSITNLKTLNLLSRKTEAVIHLAAVVSPFLSMRNPRLVNSVNVAGTLNVLDAAKRNGIERVVCASSSSVYGDAENIPIPEASLPQPITPYGVSKLAAERYTQVYYRALEMETVALRYFNAYGPRQSANPYSGVIAIFANNLRRGKQLTIFGDGRQTRDFIHVSDVAASNLLALRTKRGIGEAFNIGTGKATTINELASMIAQAAGRSRPAIKHVAPRRGDIHHSVANIQRAKRLLGFKSTVQVKSGLGGLIANLP